MSRSQRSPARDDAFGPQGDFNEQLYAALKRSPWWMISIGGHLAVFLVMSSFSSPAEAATVRKPPTLSTTTAEKPIEQEAPPMEEPGEPMPDPTVPTEYPDPIDAEVDDVAKDDADTALDQVSGEVDGPSSGPFEGLHENTDLGTGGGAVGGDGWGSDRRRSRGRPGGPGKPKEDAVLHALRWLASHQSEDGGWEAAGFDRWCDGKPATGERPDGPGMAMYDAGVTGLALCAFLGAGYSNRGEHEFTKVVRRGLAYLKNVQDPEGCFGPRSTQHYIYNHATAALAMVEAFGMTESPIFKGSAQKALDFLALARNPYFAWRYGVKPGDNDTSVTGWMMMALKSAQLINTDAKKRGRPAPLVVDEDAFDGIRAWLDKMTDPDYGRVGYIARGQGPARPQGLVDRFPAERSESMTAVGVLARIFLHEDPRKSDLVKKGVDLCLRRLPTWNPADGSIDMYYWYYASLALFQVGGEPWKRWEAAMYAAIVPSQRMDGTYCGSKGSWDPLDPWGAEGGRVYSTAVLCMCLEVLYRYERVAGTK